MFHTSSTTNNMLEATTGSRSGSSGMICWGSGAPKPGATRAAFCHAVRHPPAWVENEDITSATHYQARSRFTTLCWAFIVSTYFYIFHILIFTRQGIHLSVPLNLHCQLLLNVFPSKRLWGNIKLYILYYVCKLKYTDRICKSL